MIRSCDGKLKSMPGAYAAAAAAIEWTRRHYDMISCEQTPLIVSIDEFERQTTTRTERVPTRMVLVGTSYWKEDRRIVMWVLMLLVQEKLNGCGWSCCIDIGDQ